ncbi:NADPH:quinone reductase-like Zn-dependent oxidoreductase [Kribbella antiqua]|uniref:NADPH:quinone reductase-like Zn-dependent oxidoreductase n=1 Tax=Kribbella antiqua TaxID=2512217 RepID=A0A4R2J1F6_9ACTN|nr:zinc-binding dehydrogenase [Kribbella antiqua]TCO49165.1 NADPH:quinone reductase-like Zn-dependent oxidoreductase [Kribbella antiqua]
MRAVRYHEYGGPEVLRLEDVAVPEPGSGQVLIEVEAIGANAIDAALRSGNTPWDRPLPAALTGDVVGRISKLGPDAPPGVAVGQRVAALAEDAFAEYAVSDFVVPIPDDADAGEASMMSMTAPLALRLLEAGRIPAGGTILIHSAAGTIGHLAVQLARFFDPKTIIGTASSAARLDFIRSIGADAAVNLTDENWPDQVRAVAPDGVDTILDAVGGKVFDQGMELLNPLGTMVTYGAISGELPTVPASSLFGLKSVTGVGIVGWRTIRPAEARADVAEVVRRWQAGDLRPVVDTTYPLAEVARLHETLDARKNLGRLIAIP